MGELLNQLLPNIQGTEWSVILAFSVSCGAFGMIHQGESRNPHVNHEVTNAEKLVRGSLMAMSGAIVSCVFFNSF